MYPGEVHVRNGPDGLPMLVVEFDPPRGVGVVLSIQGASVLARELRKAVRAYLNPQPAAEPDSEETG